MFFSQVTPCGCGKNECPHKKALEETLRFYSSCVSHTVCPVKSVQLNSHYVGADTEHKHGPLLVFPIDNSNKVLSLQIC